MTCSAYKDEIQRIYPCIRPYDQLEETEKVKDHRFCAVGKTIQRQNG